MFAIKPNNAAIKGPCPECGQLNDPRIPFELFPVDSWQPLCSRCAHDQAPCLARMLDAWYLVGADMAVHQGFVEESASPF